ncbi:MAG: hypothetical protein ACQGVC_16830 [Myxococcota bacterium]
MRALLQIGTAVVVWLALEAGGWAGLLAIHGEPVGWRGLAAERSARADGAWRADDAETLVLRGRRPDRQVARALHPFLGWVRDADRSDLGSFGATDPDAREYGFPSNPAPLFQAPDPERLVVVVLGGSFAEALVRDASDTLAQALAAEPRFAGRTPLVLNLALPGFKQPQQLMALSWFLALGAHFDLVINLDGYNEVVASVTNLETRGVFPAYPKRWFERVGPLDGDLRLAVGEAAFVTDLRSRAARWASREPWRFSFLAGLVWKLLDRHLEDRLAGALARMAEGDPASRYPARGPRGRFASEEEVLDHVAALWSRASRQMDALARSVGAEYHHFLQPNQYVEGSKPWSETEERRFRQTATRRAELVAGAYPRLQREGAALRDAGVAFHDLTDAFGDVRDTVYADACCHVNRLGSRVVARAVAAAVAVRPPRLD